MASGANRGAYYAGFLEPLQEAGIEFDLMAGVSAGGIAAAWFAAGDPEALIDSWRQADPWRIAPHPWMSFGRFRTVDRLIQKITLRTMDVRAARTARAEVVVAAARVVGPGLPLPRLELAYLSNRDAADEEAFGLMLRATAFVPYINGLRERGRDRRRSLSRRRPRPPGAVLMVPEGRFDELWIAACSPTVSPNSRTNFDCTGGANGLWWSLQARTSRSAGGPWSGRRSAAPSTSGDGTWNGPSSCRRRSDGSVAVGLDLRLLPG